MAAELAPDDFAAFADVVEGLSPRRRALLLRMAEALTVPSDVVRYDSDLVDDAFADTLANSLLLHHAVHEEPVRAENLCHQAIFMNHASGAVAPPDTEVV